MELSNTTARALYEEIKAKPRRRPFGFGAKAAIVNVDLQLAYTRPGEFPTAYETDPQQLAYIDRLSALVRARGWPVVWTIVAYAPSGVDCLAWGTRSDGPDALQNIKHGSRRALLDDRLTVDPARDVVLNKTMPSAFHDTPLSSLLTWRQVDTVIVTGGSTSGCVRATVVDGLSRGFRMIVPEECVADVHESPHFASLYDMAAKYADVLPVAEVAAFLSQTREN